MGCFLSQRSFFLCGEIVEDDVKLTIRERGNEAVHEAEELDTTAPLGMRRELDTDFDARRCMAAGLARKRYVGRMCNAACVDQDTRPPVRAGDAAPADALDLCFLLYRRLDCVDYAFCDLILQVEYAG